MGENVLSDVDYVFAENGLVAYKDGKLLKEMVSGFIVCEMFISSLKRVILLAFVNHFE